MTMDKEKLKKKYGMSLAPRPPELANWKESPAVVKLRTFIQENRQHGIHVVIRDGRPALQFVPGLNKGNSARWEACLAAEVMLFEAAPDLMKLINQKKLELPDRAPDPVEPEKSEQGDLWRSDSTTRSDGGKPG